jgi:hypothetical protein
MAPIEVSAETIDSLSSRYISASREERRAILRDVVDKIIEIGRASDVDVTGSDTAILKNLGASLKRLVLSETSPRQFVCKLATRIALIDRQALPRAAQEHIIAPMIEALVSILEVGPPATRDVAVEGLGGLLKGIDGPGRLIPIREQLRIERIDGEKPDEEAARAEICKEYFVRLERRRLLVLTIAGEADATKEFWERLRPSLSVQLRVLLDATPVAWDEIENLLYSYPDLLRILPAVARQSAVTQEQWLDLLCDAIQLQNPDHRPFVAAPASVTRAFGRLQENVFRTLDTVIRRFNVDWQKVDDAVSHAVRAIPAALEGSPADCNQTVRSTVALLRTASRLLTTTPASNHTKEALRELYSTISSEPWFNIGIVEGAFRTLSEILPHSRFDDLSEPLSAWLIHQLRAVPSNDDLTGVHRYLVANSCLRRILATALDRATPTDIEATQDAVAAVLRALSVPSLYRLRYANRVGTPGGARSLEVAPAVVANFAFEIELLRRTKELLSRWQDAASHDRVLLTRILALQLHSLARDGRELERHSFLQHFWRHSTTAPDRRKATDAVVRDLLKNLPPDAADTADTEIQRFVEFRGYREEEPMGWLPGYVSSMISACVTGPIASAIAREITLHLERQQALTESSDLAGLLYHVILRDSPASIFDHLWPRVRDERERDIVSLFRRHVAGLASVASSEDNAAIISHFATIAGDRALHLPIGEHGSLERFRDALGAYKDLTVNSENIWDSLSGERTIDLLGELDSLAISDAHRNPLMPLKKRLTDLQDDVIHYLALPVGQFAERQDILSDLMEHALKLRDTFGTHTGLAMPERMLLNSFAQHTFNLFDDTRRWFCDEARKLKERNERDRFWLFFCDDRGNDERIGALGDLGRSKWNMFLHDPNENEYIARATSQLKNEPPCYKFQRARFAKFFVEWMEADLDVATLRRTLRTRWPFYFRWLYAVITNMGWVSLIMFTPFALAAWLDSRGSAEWAGIGFFVLAAFMLGLSFIAFTQLMSWLRRRIRGEKKDRPGFWFRCLLPRLARLTAVPMALIVEFEHSYEFPLHASTLSILLLALISFVTTRFFVVREMIGPEDAPEETAADEQRKRAWRIVAVALAHSFGIAIVLSAIFASSYDHLRSEAELEPVVETVEGKPGAFWNFVETVFERFDNPKPHEKYPRFLGVLPRVARVDFGTIAKKTLGEELPAKVSETAVFNFYPTIVLVWTALGLFFGVFLEGFLKGERLRGSPFDVGTVARD